MNTIVCKIPKKNKLIKIADRFPAGWATIAEYEDNPFASDSENSKKIQQGENRALAKAKTKAHLPRQVNQIVPIGLSFGMTVSSMDSVPPPQPFPFFFLPFKPENQQFTQSQEKMSKPTDTCCGCRQTGHWCSRSPKTNQNRN